MIDPLRLRRWFGGFVLIGFIAGAVLILPRIVGRSPIAYVLVPALAIVALKFVEWRMNRWFRRLAAREAARQQQSGRGRNGPQTRRR
jgi:hypothetical protein